MLKIMYIGVKQTKDKDIVDLMCEYELYYQTFKDDPNDPFCHSWIERKANKSPVKKIEAEKNKPYKDPGKYIALVYLGVLVVAFLCALLR